MIVFMNKFILFLLCISFAISLDAQSTNYLLFDRKIIKEKLSSPVDFKPVPRAIDSFWRNSIPVEMQAGYIRYGMSYHERPWELIPDSVFSDYRNNGNRSN